MIRDCAWCEPEVRQHATFICPGCKKERWCGTCREEAEDWHIVLCPNPVRPLTTAHRLVLASFHDLFPEDPQTKEDFYLNNTTNAKDRMEMFELYQRLINHHRVAPRTLQKWGLEGSFVENIKRTFETSPRLSTKEESYKWFLEHQDLVAPQNLRDPGPLKRRINYYCAGCQKPALSCCSGCKKAWYCSKECQKNEWLSHIVDCSPGRPLIPADYLGAYVHRHWLPDHAEVEECFGFTALIKKKDQHRLAECYRIIFRSGIKSKKLEQWRLSGKLGEEMISVLQHSKDPASELCFRWLRGHTHIFGPDAPKRRPDEFEDLDQSLVHAYNMIADRPVSRVEELTPILSKWPDEKADCFLLYSMHVGQLGVPGPNKYCKIYLTFGYCACHKDDEKFLHVIYRMLVECCSFKEIFLAYESSNLIGLMDKHGMRQRRVLSPYLEDVLSGSPRSFKSVWELKQFILDPESIRRRIPLTVKADYGFSNCQSEEEYSDLKELYTELLQRRDANPLALHEACIQGRLFEHVSEIFPRIKKSKVRDKYRRLMRNPHPLPLPVVNKK